MLKHSLKHPVLHCHRLTDTLLQRIKSFHQFSLCDVCVTGWQTLCSEPKHVPQKLSLVNTKMCLSNIHAREFHCGMLGKYSDKTNENKTIEEISIEHAETDSWAKDHDGHALNHGTRDVTIYGENNMASEIKDLQSNRQLEVFIPDNDHSVPKIYKPQSIITTILEDKKPKKKRKSKSDSNSGIVEMSEHNQLKLAERGELDVGKNVEKVELPATVELSEIVNESEVLQEFVKLGVDLTSLQKKGMIETVMRMDAIKDIAPYVFFLQDHGVLADQVGTLINRCPWIFQHPLHNLQVRVDYLRSKKFKTENISNMLERDPKFLLVPVDKIDARLGFVQKMFDLTGDQIRQKVGGYSKLIIAPSIVLKQNALVLEKEFGFSKDQLKTIFLAYPKTFHRSPKGLLRSFEYLHNVMEVSLDLIAQSPRIMSASEAKIESRHRFLVKCGRAQYDPTKENYVSLMSFISLRDEEWCFEIAKSSVAEYNKFLKMI